MPLTVVVGGQYGSEGKGKIAAHVILRDNVDIAVRCGGPNSGHTVDLCGRRYELRSLSAGFVNRNTRLLVPSGAVLSPEIFLAELARTGTDRARVGIDRHAGIVSDRDTHGEASAHLRERIGSTLSGTGFAVANRALRSSDFHLAKEIPALQGFLTDVSQEVNEALDRGAKVLVEGTQGFGLSVYHSPHYPFATSRDTTVSGFLSEVGVSARLVSQIIMAVRTYPIRVGGNSGPLPNETTWDIVRRDSGYPTVVEEYTTATKRLRRVAFYDHEIVHNAARVNRPTHLALHGADYLSYRNKGVTEWKDLSPEARRFAEDLEARLDVPVALMGTGPTNEELVDRME